MFIQYKVRMWNVYQGVEVPATSVCIQYNNKSTIALKWKGEAFIKITDHSIHQNFAP